MNRIRYTKPDPQGNCNSVKVLMHPTNGARYMVRINPTSGEWRIEDDFSRLLVKGGINKHPHKLKIDVREALAALGVVVAVEARTKKAVV